MRATRLRWRFVALLAAILCGAIVPVYAQKITYGAIRWDAWTQRYVTPNQSLAPSAYEFAMPFYSTIVSPANPRVISIDGTTQAIMDREIDFARDAKLDFWIFIDYWTSATSPAADFFNETFPLYLSSAKKNDVKFAWGFTRASAITATDWTTLVNQVTGYVQMSNYQKVLGGRALIFLFRDPTVSFGAGNVNARLTELRNAITGAGQPNPYIVMMDGTSAMVDSYGLQAMTGYSGGAQNNQTYSQVAAANTSQWNNFKNAGKKVIPTVSVGWGGPRQVFDGTMTAANVNIGQPTRAEFKSHLAAARNWVNTNSTAAEADVAIMYAWNEYDEGGRLGAAIGGSSAPGGADYLAVFRDFQENVNLPSGVSPATESTPRAPTNAVTVPLTATKIRVIWADQSQVETGYRIERKTGASAFAEVAQIGANVTWWDDTTVAPSTLYDYRVRAEKTGVFSGYSNTASGQAVFGLRENSERISDNTDRRTSMGRYMYASTATAGYLGSDYRFAAFDQTDQRFAQWNFHDLVTLPGTYEVFARWTSDTNRATNARYEISTQNGSAATQVFKNQQTQNGTWVSLGTYNFVNTASVRLDRDAVGTNGTVVADGVRFVPAGATLLADAFTDGNDTSPAWNRVLGGSSWSVVSGVYKQSSTSSSAGSQVSVSAVSGAGAWNNYRLISDIKVTAVDAGHTTSWAAGIVARYQDANNLLTLRLRPDKLELGKFVGGTFTVLDSEAGTFATGTTYVLTFAVNSGGALSGSVKNTSGVVLASVSATDTSFSSGTAGLRTSWAAAEFDDVTVTGP